MDKLHSDQPLVTPQPPHPFIFAVLIAPFGASGGFITVALAFLATQRGLTVQQGAELIATMMLPNVWKFFWAPIADTTLSRRRWYLISSLCCAAGTFATAAIPLGPPTLRLIQILVLATSVANTFLGFSVEAMMAHLTPKANRGRVSGWFQAGNLGGAGIGGGLGLWLLTKLPAGWEAGLILAIVMLGCAAVLPLLPDVAAESRNTSIGGAVRRVGSELWEVIRSRDGVLAAVLCFVPVGTGAAAGVLAQSSVAAHWGAGSGQVELVQGFLGGIVSMFGCIAGGYGCARLGARTSYVVFGGIMATITAVMALLPATPLIYVAGNLAYAFVNGLCFAAFTGFVLDAIGAGVAATKYNGFAFASRRNTPIWYMGLFLAAVQTSLGPPGHAARRVGLRRPWNPHLCLGRADVEVAPSRRDRSTY